MYTKIHKSGNKEILAVCDEDIIGRVFEEGDLQLKVSEYFFYGEKKSEKEVLKLIEEFENVNLVGKKTIKLALDNNIISKENVITIRGIPHVQIYNL
ncbi:DUF424 family protein [Candidatus Woesearchaeota archaeon]|nr:DUF424 family protein [Candidatus Woesearchaeota archaeon]